MIPVTMPTETETPALHPDRFFDPDPAVRDIARELYARVRNLPIVSPHGHCDPRWFADNEPFDNPAALIVSPDHYLYRMLYSRGVPLETLGLPARDGSPVESDPRRIWQTFAEHAHLFAGTPSGLWLRHTLAAVFGIEEKLASDTAAAIYDRIAEALARPEFRPRALYERFGLEVLCTTDAAADPLSAHAKIAESDWPGRVIPCLRPDALFAIAESGWRAELEALSAAVGFEIGDVAAFIRALEDRRVYFRARGAVATDHGVQTPLTLELTDREREALFARALRGEADEADARLFGAHMLMEMARMSCEDGLVMQLHSGSLRNHNWPLFERFGSDRGADIPVATEYTRNLRPLLNRYGNDPRLTLIVFTLDESAYSRELAPLAGHYPALRLGPPWWFHDSVEGMLRYRRRVTETAGIWNTVGFNDDTRSFVSIPARHDLARRMDCTWLAGLVARHIIDREESERMSLALARDLVREAYRLDGEDR